MKEIVKSHKFSEIEIALVVAFTILGIFAESVPYFGFDLQITNLVQSMNPLILAPLMTLVSAIGNLPTVGIIIITTCFILYRFGYHRETHYLLFAALGGFFIGSLVKSVVRRPRPSSDIVSVMVELSDKSFPSNHVIFFVAFFGFLLFLSLYVFRNLWAKTTVFVLTTFLILTVGISRIYLGAHWTSDVLGGYLLGTAFLLTLIQIYRRTSK